MVIHPSAPEERFGPYRLSAEIDAGVATTVWRAAHPTLERPVAVKRLRPAVSMRSKLAASLEREAKILSELSHPHVIALYDFVKTDETFGLVLEHVEGHRLDAAREAAGGRFRSGEVAAIGAALADALAHVHERGIVHRDVKPGNVLLGKHGELKLLDFGAAAYAGETDARASSPDGDVAFGTPAYLAPEQIFGVEADPKSDVFSLGVVLYELASGHRPFEGRAARGELVPLERRVSDVDKILVDAIERALSPLPADRPSAEALAATLGNVAGAMTPARAVRAVLGRARLVELSSPPGTSAPRVVVPRARPPRALAPALVAAAIALVALAAFWIGRSMRRETNRVATALEVGEVRVLASPWAEVWLDGKHVETTPFARPLITRAGNHRVVLRHPDAPDEVRDVVVSAAQPVALDVTMAIKELAALDAAPADASIPDAGGGG